VLVKSARARGVERAAQAKEDVMRLVGALLAALIFGTVAAPAPAAASTYYGRPSLEVDVGLFYDDLAPYGDWVETGDYGWGWSPHAPAGWRPYTAGYWVWTDAYGPLWVSSEPYGWAVYHYGRWYLDPVYGWIWIPGYEWGPSWVSFRNGGGYIGWAPLPPRVGWQLGVGFRVGPAVFDSWISPSHYCFVPERRFFDHSIPSHIVHGSRNTTIIHVTQNITNYDVVQGRVVNRSFRVDQLERAVRHAVPRVRPVDLGSAQAVRQARARSDEVPVFRPRVHEARSLTPPRGKALPRRAGGAPPADFREQASRQAEPRPQQRQAEPTVRRELDKHREEAARREVEARQQLERAQREQNAKREAEARRLADKQREEASRREVEVRQQLERAQRAQNAKREAEARRLADEQREEASRREVEVRQQLERRQPSARERRPAAAQRAVVREEPRTQRSREVKDAVSKSREKDKRKEK
jgi:hypothetical protein